MSDTELMTEVNNALDEEVYKRKPQRPRPKYSNIWNKFTILNNKEYLAQCNICQCRMSYRTTVTNLKKHLIRKHNYDCNTSSVISSKPKQKERIITPTARRPNLTELGGLDGLILNVVGEDGDPLGEQNMEGVEERVVYAEVDGHDYCTVLEGSQVEETETERGASKPQPTTKFQERMDRNKRNRIMDLQLECLEIKKYNMQMEALMLEHQLNLPRSIHTETLRRSDTMTRSTQTEVGGNNTKVFFVSDNGAFRESSQHLFTFQARLDDK